MAGSRCVPHTARRVPRRSQIEGAHMRTKQGLVALLSCSAVAFGGIAADTAAAKTTVHHKATKKSAKKSKRCKILLVNGIHRCKGEHALKKVSSNSSTAPTAPAVVNVTINNNPPAPVPAPAAPAASSAASASAPGPQGNPPFSDDGKPGKGPKDKD